MEVDSWVRGIPSSRPFFLNKMFSRETYSMRKRGSLREEEIYQIHVLTQARYQLAAGRPIVLLLPVEDSSAMEPWRCPRIPANFGKIGLSNLVVVLQLQLREAHLTAYILHSYGLYGLLDIKACLSLLASMALISVYTIIRAISLFHLTAAYFFLTAPRMIADQNVVFMLGEAIRVVSTG